MSPDKITTKEQAQKFIDKYDWFLFDCDGVLWLGDHLLPKITETINFLSSQGKKLLFVTNNSTKSREDYLHKFSKFGIHISKDEVFGSAYASAVYIKKILKLPTTSKIWVLGESGIETELHELGYSTLGGTDPNLNVPFNPNLPILQDLDPLVDCVLVGLTTNLNYLKMATTLRYLQRKGTHFIATNIDSTFPQKGMVLPGAGSIIESVAFAAGRQPDVSCGKPSQSMLDAIVAQHKFDRSRACMVGDRLNTDMRFGKDGGLGTLLVLSGIETEENALKSDQSPLYYADKLGDLYELLVEDR